MPRKQLYLCLFLKPGTVGEALFNSQYTWQNYVVRGEKRVKCKAHFLDSSGQPETLKSFKLWRDSVALQKFRTSMPRYNFVGQKGLIIVYLNLSSPESSAWLVRFTYDAKIKVFSFLSWYIYEWKLTPLDLSLGTWLCSKKQVWAHSTFRMRGK